MKIVGDRVFTFRMATQGANLPAAKNRSASQCLGFSHIGIGKFVFPEIGELCPRDPMDAGTLKSCERAHGANF